MDGPTYVFDSSLPLAEQLNHARIAVARQLEELRDAHARAERAERRVAELNARLASYEAWVASLNLGRAGATKAEPQDAKDASLALRVAARKTAFAEELSDRYRRAMIGLALRFGVEACESAQDKAAEAGRVAFDLVGGAR